jgi:hypothetical protein
VVSDESILRMGNKSSAAALPQKQQPQWLEPGILGIGSALWRLCGWLGNVDFVLTTREETFRVMFQGYWDYGWWITILIAVVWYVEKRRHPQIKPFAVHWGTVASVGCVCFLFGILAAAKATGAIPNVIATWSADRGSCFAVVDTSKLIMFRDKFDVYLICGVADPTVDQMRDTLIATSHAYTITGLGVSIAVSYPQSLKDKLSPLPQNAMINAWQVALLLPKDVDIENVRTLADVKKQGGHIIAPNVF